MTNIYLKEDQELKDLVNVLLTKAERRMVKAVAKRLAESEVFDEYFIQCSQKYAKAYGHAATDNTAELGNVVVCRKSAPVKQVVSAVKDLIYHEGGSTYGKQ